MSNIIEQKETKTGDPFGTEGTRREYFTNTIFLTGIILCSGADNSIYAFFNMRVFNIKF